MKIILIRLIKVIGFQVKFMKIKGNILAEIESGLLTLVERSTKRFRMTVFSFGNKQVFITSLSVMRHL